jgi:hypothetical protein
MQGIGRGVGIKDENSSSGISWRLKGIKVAEVESLIAKRGAEAKACEMVRH